MTEKKREARAEAAFRFALHNEDEAIREEFLAEVASAAALTYRGRIPLRIGRPETLRTYAKHARAVAEQYLKEAVEMGE